MKKQLLKKLALFAAGVLASVGLNAQTTLLEYTPAETDVFSKTSHYGVENALAVTGGSVYYATAAEAKTISWNSGKGLKFGNTGAFVIVKLASGTFTEGDEVLIENLNSDANPFCVIKYTGDDVNYKSSTGIEAVPGTAVKLTADYDGTSAIVLRRVSSSSFISKLTITSPVRTPALTSFALAGVDGVIDQAAGTVTIELPYGSTEPTAEQIIAGCTKNSAATEDVTYDPSSKTITVTDGVTPKVYVLTVTISTTVPAPTLATTSSNARVKQGAAISDIVYTYANAKDDASVIVSGLPEGLNYGANGGTLTISGTVDASAPARAYNYNVTVTGLEGAEPATATASGVITVVDASAKSVAYLYTSTDASASPLYTAISSRTDLDVNVIDASTLTNDATTIATELSGYDLVVMDEKCGSSLTGALGMGTMIGKIPFLNAKEHMYGKTNWPAGSGSNTTCTAVTIASNMQSHPIFNTLDVTGGSLAVGTLRGATVSASAALSKEYVIATNGEDASLATIYEQNNGTTGVNKYMLIAMQADQAVSAEMTTVINNAVDYLLDASALFVASANTEAELMALTVNGVSASISGTDAIVTLPEETTDLTATTLVSTISTGATLMINNVEATGNDVIDASSKSVSIAVTAEDGKTTNTYTLTITTEAVAVDVPTLTDYISAESADNKWLIGGTVTANYVGNDASLWIQEEETTPTVLRFGKTEKVDMIVNVTEETAVNIGVSATGGRTFVLAVDGTETATVSPKANTMANLTATISAIGVHTVSVYMNGASGDGTIGSINFTVPEPATGVDEAETKVVDSFFLTLDGKKVNGNVENIPVVKVDVFSNGKVVAEKQIAK